MAMLQDTGPARPPHYDRHCHPGDKLTQLNLLIILITCIHPFPILCFSVAWFVLDPAASHPQLSFSDSNAAVSCDSFEPCVAMATTGFSRGVHYWEFTLEQYDGNADPAFGVARLDATKSQMLGKTSLAVCLSWTLLVRNGCCFSYGAKLVQCFSILFIFLLFAFRGFSIIEPLTNF